MPAIVALSLAIGLAIGLINGLLVTKRSVSPFLATLATMILLQGFRFAYTQGAPSGNVPPFFRILGSEKARGIPYNFMILAVVALRCSGSSWRDPPSAAGSISSAAIRSPARWSASTPTWSRSPAT